MNTLVTSEPSDSASETACPPQTMTRVLRWLGAITLIAAGSCYLVSSWMMASPITRFYGFLGFTAFLAAAGIFCGVRWHEDKGARTFLALSALFVPACTAQLSGLIEAQLGHAMPVRWELLHSEPVGVAPLFLAMSVGAILIIPICFLTFSAMARPEAARLTLVYVAANAVLLLPTRAPNTVAIIAAAMLSFHLLMDCRYFARTPLMKHWDGVAVRLTLGLPLVVFVGRTLLLYDYSQNLVGVVLAALGMLYFYGLPRCISSDLVRIASRLSGLALFAAAWLQFSDPLVRLSGATPVEAAIPFRVFPITLIMFGLSFHAEAGASVLRRTAGVAGIAALLIHLLAFGGLGITIVSLAAAVAVVSGAFWFGDRLFLITGASGFVITLAHALISVREFWAGNLWISLGTIGVVILLASSLIERNWHRLRKSGAALKTEWDSWR